MNKNTLFAIAWPLTLTGAFITGKIVSTKHTNSSAIIKSAKKEEGLNVNRSSSSNDRFLFRKDLTFNEIKAHIIQTVQISEADFEANFGIQKIMQLDDPAIRSGLLLNLVENMSSDDFLTIISAFDALNITQQRLPEYSQLLYAWAKINPSAALDYSKKNESSTFAEQVILSSWVKNNPDAAIEWVRNAHDLPGTNPYTIGLIQGLTQEGNIELATEFLEDLTHVKIQHPALDVLLENFHTKDTETGLAWVDKLDNPSLKSSASLKLVEHYAKEDPHTVATWVESIENREIKLFSAHALTRAWDKEDLSGAKKWLDSNVPLDFRTIMARSLMEELVIEDPHGTAQWVQTMQRSNDHQNLLSSYIKEASSAQHFEAALSQTHNLQRGHTQDTLYTQNFSSWFNENQQEALAWLTTNQVSETAQTRINEIIEKEAK